MSAALFFAFVTGFLATVSGALLAALYGWSYDRRRSTNSAIMQVQALKVRNPESRFEDYLPIIGRLPASKYSDELHQQLFGFQERRRVVVEVPTTDDPFAHLKGAEGGETIQGVILTPQEMELVQLVAQGVPNAEIARRLSISESVVTSMVSALVTRFSTRRPRP